VYPEKSFFQLIFDEVRERTWLGFFLPPAVRDAGKITWKGRTLLFFEYFAIKIYVCGKG